MSELELKVEALTKRVDELESYVKKLGVNSVPIEDESKHMENILSGKGGGLDSGGEDMFEKMQKRKAEMLAVQRREKNKVKEQPVTDRDKRVAALKKRLSVMNV